MLVLQAVSADRRGGALDRSPANSFCRAARQVLPVFYADRFFLALPARSPGLLNAAKGNFLGNLALNPTWHD
jgi:hypothetical protein